LLGQALNERHCEQGSALLVSVLCGSRSRSRSAIATFQRNIWRGMSPGVIFGESHLKFPPIAEFSDYLALGPLNLR